MRTPEGLAGWVDAATGEPVGSVPLVYPDGLIVLIRGESDVSVVFSGEIKPGITRSVVKPGLNLVTSPQPAGGSLQKLGLENDLKKLGAGSGEPDKVWVADGPWGHFTVYALTIDNEWLDLGTGEKATESVPVGSALLIERNGLEALFSLGD